MTGIVKKRVVVVGGGTGTHTVLSGLKHYPDLELAAVVAMTDSGGSTGRLRDEFGYLPVGDVRMALVALARETGADDQLLRRLFLHRFSTKGDISGHNFGNLLLMALTDLLGSEDAAIEAASQVLRVSGTVIPVTRERVHLTATYDDGSFVVGEHTIDEPEVCGNRRITNLGITPEATLHEKARDALISADCIVFGPGDLYTSVLANCVIPGFKEVIDKTQAKLIYISNLMTKRGQTDDMGLRAHVDTLTEYVGRTPSIAITNTTPLPSLLLERYAEEYEYPVAHDGCSGDTQVLEGDFLATEAVSGVSGDTLRRSLIRHDPHKLAHALHSAIHGVS